MKCPDCRRNLPEIATACRCGWVAELSPAYSVQLRQDAEERRAAEIAALTEQARKNLEAQGLSRRDGESFADWRRRTMAYCREKLSGIGRAHELP